MRRRRTAWLLLVLAACLMLSGCRVRVTDGNGDAAGLSAEPEERQSSPQPGAQSPEETGQPPADEAEPLPDGNGETGKPGGVAGEAAGEIPGGSTRENPEASRKEYDENAPAEIVPGTERTLYAEGEGGGYFALSAESETAADRLTEAAEETATQTVAAEEAEKMGVSEDAEEADSALTYFTVLLQERAGSLFECQRLNVYWETAEDHVTVFRTSREHSLILNAGAYDVSARLLEENLRVDDGWISRKNPGVIVKVVDRHVLGTGVASGRAAQAVYAEMTAREGFQGIDAVRNRRVILLSEELLEAQYLQTAAMLMIAGTANPELYADVDIGRALEMLAEEATGSIPVGVYYYSE